MASYSFESILVRPEGVGTWTYLGIPPEISASFGDKGQVRVKGTINGFPYRSTALPMGDGTHYPVVAKDIREQINATQGNKVTVTLELDREERRIETPPDLEAALENNPTARLTYQKLAYSHQKAYVDWITGAKQADTRQRRIDKTLELLAQGKKLR